MFSLLLWVPLWVLLWISGFRVPYQEMNKAEAWTLSMAKAQVSHVFSWLFLLLDTGWGCGRPAWSLTPGYFFPFPFWDGQISRVLAFLEGGKASFVPLCSLTAPPVIWRPSAFRPQSPQNQWIWPSHPGPVSFSPWRLDCFFMPNTLAYSRHPAPTPPLKLFSSQSLFLFAYLNCGVGEDFLRVPWTARRSNQSILKDVSPGCSLEGLMLKLKLQSFGELSEELTLLKRPWCWEGLGAGGEGDDRGWDGWMASLTQWAWVWVISGSWWWTGRPGVLRFMGLQRVRHDWATDWTDLFLLFYFWPHWVFIAGQFQAGFSLN